MGVRFEGWGHWANDASGTPQPKQRPEAWEGRRGLPRFLIPGLRGLLFLFLVGEGLCLPYILHPPPHPDLNCEGIRICNVRLQKGTGGLLQWPLNLEGRAGSGVPRWAEGGQAPGRLWVGRGRATGRAPCLGVESGLADQAWRPGSRIQPAASLGSEVGTSPSRASVSSLNGAVLGGGG